MCMEAPLEEPGQARQDQNISPGKDEDMYQHGNIPDHISLKIKHFPLSGIRPSSYTSAMLIKQYMATLVNTLPTYLRSVNNVNVFKSKLSILP